MLEGLAKGPKIKTAYSLVRRRVGDLQRALIMSDQIGLDFSLCPVFGAGLQRIVARGEP